MLTPAFLTALLLLTTIATADAQCDPPSECLGGTGPRINVIGNFPDGYDNQTLPANVRLSLQSGGAPSTFHDHSNVKPLVLDGPGPGCSVGGKSLGDYTWTFSDGDAAVAGGNPLSQVTSPTWDFMHDSAQNHGGIEVQLPGFFVEALHVERVEDGVRPTPDGSDFRVKGTHGIHVADDCVDDHEVHGGLVEDSLFDGCYVAIAVRPNGSQDGRANTLTIRNSLFRQELSANPHSSESPPAHGAVFKWDSMAPKLALSGNIFVAIKTAATMFNTAAVIASCSNNTLVWLGTGSPPAIAWVDPVTLQPCFTVTTDYGVFTTARATWLAGHPY